MGSPRPPRRRRLRRQGGEEYEIHYEDLGPEQIGWWQEIPTVTAKTAIMQCTALGAPTHLLRQAIERGHAQGYLRAADVTELSSALKPR